VRLEINYKKDESHDSIHVFLEVLYAVSSESIK